MPIKGKVLYTFRWFWRQDISTQAQTLAKALPSFPKLVDAVKKNRAS